MVLCFVREVCDSVTLVNSTETKLMARQSAGFCPQGVYFRNVTDMEVFIPALDCIFTCVKTQSQVAPRPLSTRAKLLTQQRGGSWEGETQTAWGVTVKGVTRSRKLRHPSISVTKRLKRRKEAKKKRSGMYFSLLFSAELFLMEIMTERYPSKRRCRC